MHLDCSDYDAHQIYKVLSALVVPRPIAWVSTLSKEGVSNIAPFSFFNVMGVRPPIIAFAPGSKGDGSPKDTPRNIIDTGEFVVNLVDEVVIPQMVESAKPYEADVSEVEMTGLVTALGVAVNAPRIVEAPVSMECKLNQVVEIGQNRLIVGEVLHVHVEDGVIDPETLNFNKTAYTPVGRMASPDNYCRTINQFKMS